MSEEVKQKALRGFALMTAEQRKAVASQGGKAAHATGRAHKFTRGEARMAGKKGGTSVSQDKAHMAEIGRKGVQRRVELREQEKALAEAAGRVSEPTTASS